MDDQDVLGVMRKLGVRPCSGVGGPGLSVKDFRGVVLNSDERAKLSRFDMLNASGHRCFCTTLDVPGRGKPCCVTGVPLPMGTRAEFEAAGGDVATGEYDGAQ